MTVKNKNKRKIEDDGEKQVSTSKKVKENEQVEDQQTDKKETKQKLSFDIKTFRKDLYNASNRLTSLNQFLNVCRNSDSSVDYVLKYLENGGSPGEIVKQLEGHSQKDMVFGSTVFNLFNLIIEKIQSSTAHLLQSLEDTCRYFLSSFAPMIEMMLSEKSNVKQQKITLEMLTSIVSLNSELALTILNQLSLQPKTSSHLLKHEGGKSKDSIRSQFIRFLMSFLVDGTSTVIKTLLNKQGLLASIVPDLIKDGSDIVLTVLHLLKTSVLENSAISKTLKTHLFSHQIISHIFNLFNWKKRSVDSDNLSTEKSQIETATDEILFILFTSHKYGVYFTDKSLGIGEYPKNRYLWKAIEMLSAPWNNQNAGKCLVKILNQCPDFYKPVRTVIEESFDEKPSELWYKTVKFMESIFTTINPEHIVNSNDLNPSLLIGYIKNVYLPTPILKVCSTVLKSKDNTMKKEVIGLLQVILKCLQNYLNLSIDDPVSEKVKSMLKKNLEEVLPKIFPAVDVLVMTLHNTLDRVNDEDSDVVLQSKLLLNILDLLLLYNEIIPNSFDPVLTMLDTKRLFEKIDYLNECDAVELKLKTTKFVLCADRYALAPNKPLFNEILPAMFEVLISDDVHMADSAYDVLSETLNTTGIFDCNRNEIHILLYTVRSLAKKYGSDVTPMMVNLLNTIVRNKEKYEKMLFKLSNSGKNVDSKFQDNIEELFDNLEKYGGRDENIYFLEDRPFISNFLIGLLTNLSVLENEYTSIRDFTNTFVLLLFYYQDDADRYLNVLSNFKDKVLRQTLKCKKSNKNSLDTILYKIDESLTNGTDVNLIELFSLKPSDESSSYIILNNTNYLYDKTFINRSKLIIILNMVMFDMIEKNKTDSLEVKTLLNHEKVLFFILEIGSQYEKYSKLFYVEMIKRCLSNGHLIANFDPFVKNSHLTEFVMDLIEFCNGKGVEMKWINMIYKPYKHKIYLYLITKIDKVLKLDNVERVLNLLNLDTNDALSLLKEILNMDISCMETENNEVSSWIHIICHIINILIERNILIEDDVVIKMTILYSKIITDLTINVSNLEQCLYEYLIINPKILNCIPDTVFEAIFKAKHINKFTSKIASVLLKSNNNLLSKFIKLVNEDILDKREFTVPLTVAAFYHQKFRFSTDTLNKIYNFYKPNIVKVIEKPQKATQIYIDNVEFCVKLIFNCMEKQDCETYLKKVYKFDCLETFHLTILEAVFFKFTFTDRNNLDLTYFNNFLLTILQLSVLILKKGELNKEKMDKISSILNKLIILVDKNESKIDFDVVLKSAIWQNFYKHSLKALITSDPSNLLHIISRLIEMLYTKDHKDVIELFEMLTSHSEFLNAMLTHHSDTKINIIRLLYVMTLKNEGVMKVSHIPVYLSSYQATRNTSDCLLLRLLNCYEANGHSMTEYRPYLWSDIGANYFALRSNRKKDSLWSNPTVNHVLNLLDKEVIEKTIKNFPINAKLNPDTSNFDVKFKNRLINVIDNAVLYEKYYKNSPNTWEIEKFLDLQFKVKDYNQIVDAVVQKDFTNLSFNSEYEDLYDPAFVLPLLNYVVAPGSAVSCHRIIRGGVLAIPLMALSSNCPMMRSAAFSVLHRFYTQLEAEIYYKNDKLLWTQFMNTLINSMNTAIFDEDSTSNTLTCPRLPSICALYLARSALIMTNPLDPLFKPVNNFIILKQFINFSVVPDLLDLFHTNDITYNERRIWILKILRDGLKTFDDIKVLLKSVAFKILLDFYSCSLADVKIKTLILDVVNVALSIPKAAKILIDGYGLLPWLNATFKPLNDNKIIVKRGLCVIDSLFIALISESSAKILNGNDSLNLFITGKGFKISDVQYNEILLSLLNFLNKLHMMDVDDVKVYLNILKKLPGSIVKLITLTQLLKLVNVCQSILDPDMKYCKTISLAIKNKNVKYLSTSLMLMDRDDVLKNENNIVISYLHEIVSIWLS